VSVNGIFRQQSQRPTRKSIHKPPQPSKGLTQSPQRQHPQAIALIDTCQQGRAAIAIFGAAIAEFASKELAQPSNESYIHTI
jgi:hypothetical protein